MGIFKTNKQHNTVPINILRITRFENSDLEHIWR